MLQQPEAQYQEEDRHSATFYSVIYFLNKMSKKIYYGLLGILVIIALAINLKADNILPLYSISVDK